MLKGVNSKLHHLILINNIKGSQNLVLRQEKSSLGRIPVNANGKTERIMGQGLATHDFCWRNECDTAGAELWILLQHENVINHSNQKP